MPAGLDGNPDPFVTEARTKVLASVVSMVERRRLVGQPMLVAVDGIDGSGKSTFADELAVDLAANDVRVVEWNRKIERYASGMRYYLDLVDPGAVADVVIDNNDLRLPTILRSPPGP